MIEIPLKHPKPDFDELVKVLTGQLFPKRVIAAELLIDEEVKKFIIEHFFGEKNIPPPSAQRFGGTRKEVSESLVHGIEA